MTVEIIPPEKDEELEEEEELTPEEFRRRVRLLAFREPELFFALFETLMDKLEISKEEQEEVIKGALNKWQNY